LSLRGSRQQTIRNVYESIQFGQIVKLQEPFLHTLRLDYERVVKSPDFRKIYQLKGVQPMTKKLSILIGFLLVTSLLSACAAAPIASAQQAEPGSQNQRTLTVTGSGQALLTPDIAYVTIGVHTEDKNAAEAVAANNTQAQAVTDALKGAGIAAKDIRTTNFSIYPQQQYDDKGQLQGITYVVDNSVYVTVRDLTKVGGLLDTAVKAGANSISGIQFDVADKTKALSDARKAAVANATEIATELAGAANVTLGPVQSISIYGSSPMPVYDTRAMAVEAAAVPVSPGQLNITVDVQVVFLIQ
jgi:uncharacterized protein YggE